MRRPVVEEHFGTSIVDPYRWLEGDLRSDTQVREWIEAQAHFTESQLRELPRRDDIRAQLERVWAFEKLHCPIHRGSWLFQEWNSGLLNHNVIQVQKARGDSPRTLIDPNAMDSSGGVLVRDWLPSADGSLLAYTVQKQGGDWRTLHIVDVEHNVDLSDELTGLKAAQFAWLPDNSGLVYTAFDVPDSQDVAAPTLRSAVYVHSLGQSQSADDCLFRHGGNDVLLHTPRVSDDGRWLVLLTSNAGMTRHQVRVKDLEALDSPLRMLVEEFDHRWSLIGGDARQLLFVSDREAPRGCIVSLDPVQATSQTPKVLVAEGRSTIRGCALAGDEIVVQYQDGLDSKLRRFTREGRHIADISLPASSTVDQLRGTPQEPEVFFRTSSMIQAPTVWRCDLQSDATSVYRAPVTAWHPEDYVIRQVVADSADGTQVPVTLAHHRQLDPGRPHPTAMIAYGGFGISPEMCFWETRFAWVSLGGVFAVAHTRGGAEFGADWAASARRAGRLKTVDDYLAAAARLHDLGIASPRTLVAIGASNGGLLVTAATNAKPDAFAVTLARVPPTDMLRYTRFTLGKLWVDELGDPDIEAEFKILLAYSPLHNVRPGREYPAIMVTTAEADDRVVPAHAFKYVATLQNSDIGPQPHLLRFDRAVGHGEGKPTAKLIEEYTDLWSFAGAHVGL
jgi:prolyl oligopeptidase